ncbi:MAG: hydroxyphenylacetyl-CoA thioesterase PaaI [Steroidobacteraceae bacterium]
MSDKARTRAEAYVRAMWSRDAASQALGMRVIEAGPGRAQVAMTVRADMANGHGICHGGLIFALADSAFAFACNSYGGTVVAAGATIDFLQPARVGQELLATAVECSRSRRTGLYDVSVANGAGVVIALFRGRSHRIGDNPCS